MRGIPTPGAMSENVNTAAMLEERIKQLEAELQEVKTAASNASKKARKEHATVAKQLQAKDLECESLRTQLDRLAAENTSSTVQTEKIVKVQIKAGANHNEQVQSLQTLAAQDRAWLEEETSRRRAASILMRQASEKHVTSMQKRISERNLFWARSSMARGGDIETAGCC